MAYYRSRTIRLGRHKLMWVDGWAPECEYLLDDGVLGDHCRWMMDHRHREWLRSLPMLWPVREPPRPYELRMIEIDPVSEAGGWLLTLYALWRFVR